MELSPDGPSGTSPALVGPATTLDGTTIDGRSVNTSTDAESDPDTYTEFWDACWTLEDETPEDEWTARNTIDHQPGQRWTAATPTVYVLL